MSLNKENCIRFFQNICVKILNLLGVRIPKHIAVIMDGNRRFARRQGWLTYYGHKMGVEKAFSVLKCCLKFGVLEITVYGFSIENFKRTQEEVDILMKMAHEFFARIGEINKLGVRVHVVGRMSLLPEDVRAVAMKAMIMSRHNNKMQLNIAFAYTGRDEISRTASHILDGVKSGVIDPEDIDEDLVSRALELGEPELLIRTSGEVRLSDFMLWQVSRSVLYFTDVLWPEFNFWNLLAAIIHFQRHAPPDKLEETVSEAKQNFLDKLEKNRWQERKLELEKYEYIQYSHGKGIN